MKNKAIMPIIYSAVLAAGVMLGIYITKSNGVVVAERGNGNSLFIKNIKGIVNKTDLCIVYAITPINNAIKYCFFNEK